MSVRTISLVRHEGGACIVALRGEHDLASVDELKDTLTEAADAPSLIVDLSDAAFIDSAVLGALISSHRDVVDSGRHWALVVGQGSGAAVRRILELTGLDGVMPVYSRREDALGASSQSGSAMPG
jgi:anti-anti-sigma factor